MPAAFDDLRHLTPFAVEFRYGVTPEEDETPFDKHKIHEVLQQLKAWATAVIPELSSPNQ